MYDNFMNNSENRCGADFIIDMYVGVCVCTHHMGFACVYDVQHPIDV